jgi:hypothetical protein
MFNYVKNVATKKGMATNFFHPSLLLLFLDPGSENRDPAWEKSGSGIFGINIPDPQHWLFFLLLDTG